MATAGALVGASVAGLAYKMSGQNYTVTFALATIPATLALLLTVSVRPNKDNPWDIALRCAWLLEITGILCWAADSNCSGKA